MPHARKRLILNKILKRISFFPILALQGARQTGKSFLVRELLPVKLPRSGYFSLDDETLKNRAQRNPQTFLKERDEFSPLMIDEAQKAVALFDAVKLSVDTRRVPGKFLLLGSTEFSILSGIREALTGRMGKIRVFPMCLREAMDATELKTFKPSRSEFMRYLSNGGMPGTFSVRSSENKRELFQDWLNLVCYRDLQQFKTLKLDGELAMRILYLCATLEEPGQAQIARALKMDSRKVATHLKALCDLFVLTRLTPHPSGLGKPLYFLLDCGVAEFMGADEHRRLEIFLLNERFVYHSLHTTAPHFFYYYRSNGKKRIALIEEVHGKPLSGFHILEEERIDLRDLEIVKAFQKKNKNSKIVNYAPIAEAMKFDSYVLEPWEKWCV